MERLFIDRIKELDAWLERNKQASQALISFVTKTRLVNELMLLKWSDYERKEIAKIGLNRVH